MSELSSKNLLARGTSVPLKSQIKIQSETEKKGIVYMSVNLKKGQKISLSKEQPGLKKIVVGLGWDEAKGYDTQTIDCDAFVLLLKNGKLADNSDIVFFGNLKHKSNAVEHMGDNLTGAGDGDDEQIVINLENVTGEYDRLIIGVNIYQADRKNQHFGMIENAFVRLVDAKTDKEICIYNLSDNYSGKTAMLFGEVYRYGEEWKFGAVGEGTTDTSVMEFAKKYSPLPEVKKVNTGSRPVSAPSSASSPSTSPSGSSGGCYVATAVYGSYDCPQVWTLRRYRDNVLAKTWYGRLFVYMYYGISPRVVRAAGHTRWFSKLWKGRLDRMVKKLNDKGFADTPYEDKQW